MSGAERPSVQDLLLASILLNRFEPLAPHHASWIRERLGARSDDELLAAVRTGRWSDESDEVAQ